MDRMPFLTQPGLEHVTSGLQDRGTGHQATAAPLLLSCSGIIMSFKINQIN